jgi:hypothetical protein
MVALVAVSHLLYIPVKEEKRREEEEEKKRKPMHLLP